MSKSFRMSKSKANGNFDDLLYCIIRLQSKHVSLHARWTRFCLILIKLLLCLLALIFKLIAQSSWKNLLGCASDGAFYCESGSQIYVYLRVNAKFSNLGVHSAFL